MMSKLDGATANPGNQDEVLGKLAENCAREENESRTDHKTADPLGSAFR